MARYLAYTSPARGHLYPIVPTLLELRDRGHEVHVRTLASECAALRALGLHAEPIADAIEATPLADIEGTSMEEALAKALGTFTERARHEVPDLRARSPTPTPTRCSSTSRPSAPPRLPTPPRCRGRRRSRCSRASRPAPARRRVRPRARTASLPSPASRCSTARGEQLGLAAADEPGRGLARAAVPATTPRRRSSVDLGFPPSFRFVGPGLWEPPRRPRPGSTRSRSRSWSSAPPASTSTTTRSSRRRSSRSRDEPVGRRREHRRARSRRLRGPGQRPPRALAAHGALLPRRHARLHGGMGITQKTLAAGVPLCIVPFGRDQFEVGDASRPSAPAPASARCARPRLAAYRRANAIALRDGARDVADAFARAGGATAAASALEAQLATMAPVGERGGR